MPRSTFIEFGIIWMPAPIREKRAVDTDLPQGGRAREASKAGTDDCD
jgi:hypothetical protein